MKTRMLASSKGKRKGWQSEGKAKRPLKPWEIHQIRINKTQQQGPKLLSAPSEAMLAKLHASQPVDSPQEQQLNVETVKYSVAAKSWQRRGVKKIRATRSNPANSNSQLTADNSDFMSSDKIELYESKYDNNTSSGEGMNEAATTEHQPHQANIELPAITTQSGMKPLATGNNNKSRSQSNKSPVAAEHVSSSSHNAQQAPIVLPSSSLTKFPSVTRKNSMDSNEVAAASATVSVRPAAAKNKGKTVLLDSDDSERYEEDFEPGSSFGLQTAATILKLREKQPLDTHQLIRSGLNSLKAKAKRKTNERLTLEVMNSLEQKLNEEAREERSSSTQIYIDTAEMTSPVNKKAGVTRRSVNQSHLHRRHHTRRAAIIQTSVWATTVPAVLVLESFQFLGLIELCKLRRVCHSWAVVSRQPDSWIYSHLDLSDLDEIAAGSIPPLDCIPYLRSLVLAAKARPWAENNKNNNLEQLLENFPLLQRLKIPVFRQTHEAPAILLKLQELEMVELPVDDSTGAEHGLFMRTDQLARVLAALPKLKILNLAHTDGSDEYLAYLANIPSLIILDINDFCMTDEGAISLSSMNQLTALDMQNNPKVSNIGLTAIRNGLANLKLLSIDNNHSSSNETRRESVLSEFNQLESLYIDRLYNISDYSSLRNLLSLSIGGYLAEDSGNNDVQQLNDADWLNFFSAGVAGQLLSFSLSNHYISATVLQSLIDNCSNLLVLVLEHIRTQQKLSLNKPSGLINLRNLVLKQCKWANSTFISALIANCKSLQFIQSDNAQFFDPDIRHKLQQRKIYCIDSNDSDYDTEEQLKEFLQLKYPKLDVPTRGFNQFESELFERNNFLLELKRTAIQYYNGQSGGRNWLSRLTVGLSSSAIQRLRRDLYIKQHIWFQPVEVEMFDI
jgi:hypothetical protein